MLSYITALVILRYEASILVERKYGSVYITYYTELHYLISAIDALPGSA